MVEIKRTLLSVRLWIVIALCIFINICLVVKGQSDQNFGFQETSVSVEAVRSEYYALLDECIECDIDSALKKVNDTIDFASEYYEIINLIQMKSFMLQSEQGRQQWNMAFAAEYERYNEKYSELIRQIEKGEYSYDDEQLVRSVAATKIKEQLEYLTGYEDSIDNILGSSEKLGSFSIFRDETGFANINILKTVQDFKAIEDVQVRLGNYDGIEAFFDFSITDYLLVVIMFTIIIGLSEEQKKGLYQMLRSCKYGREHLIRSQSAALLVGTTVSTLLLYGSSLITCVVIYNGTGNLFVSAQSLELFRIFPVAISIAGVILLFVVIRVLSAFAIGTFIWLVFFGKAGRMQGSVIICIAILFAEYLLFANISDTSALNYLKYFNLFILVTPRILITQYLNLYIWGAAVNIRMVGMLFGIIIVAGSINFIAFKKKYGYMESKNNFFTGLYGFSQKLTDRIICCFSEVGFERFKLLIMNGGILICILCLILLCRGNFSRNVYVDLTDKYMKEFSGEITDDIISTIDDRIETLKKGVELYNNAVVKVQADEITNAEYLTIANDHAGDKNKLSALENVKKIIIKLQKRGTELGCQLQVVDDLSFREVYGNEAEDIRMQRWIIIMLGISLLFSSYMTIEQTSVGLQQMIRSFPCGRGRLLILKYRIVIEAIITLLLITSLLETSEFIRLGGRALLSVPVQSIRALVDVSLKITLGQFLLVIYITRLLIIISITSIVLFLSSLFHRVEVAYLSICLIMLLPAVLWKYMGIEVFQWITPLKAIDVIGQITMTEGKIESALWSCAIVGIMGAGSVILMQRKWCR